ncbi:MAG: hypothetical protein O9350_11850 [Microcystis sp. LE19-388.1G]|nr:hypothetical protein [Microcystis sp. LE19-388.1G]
MKLKHVTQILSICLVFFASIECKKPRFGKEWIKGPEKEEIAPGIVYLRNKQVEKTFIKFEMDPREITITQILPFVLELQKNIQSKDFESIVRKTTLDGPLSTYFLKNGRHEGPAFDILIGDYKKNGTDIHCNFDDLFKEPLQRIDITIKMLFEPRLSSEGDLSYNIHYALAMHYDNENKLYLKVFLGGQVYGDIKHQTNLIEKLAGRCPTPNLEHATEDPNIQSLEDY